MDSAVHISASIATTGRRLLTSTRTVDDFARRCYEAARDRRDSESKNPWPLAVTLSLAIWTLIIGSIWWLA
jgi:hypothetical protein